MDIHNIKKRARSMLDLDIDISNTSRALLLKHLLTDDSGLVRLSAAWALRTHKHRTVVTGLSEALGDRDSRVVRQALWSLLAISTEAALLHCFDLMHHPEWSVRFMAAEALLENGRLGPMELPVVEEICSCPDAAGHDAFVAQIRSIDDRGQYYQAENERSFRTSFELLCAVIDHLAQK